MWTYVPDGAIGDQQNPNGIQVFAKDIDWKGEYGSWWPILPKIMNSWQVITLSPDTILPSNGYMDPGIDPTQKRAIGIKFGIGNGSTATNMFHITLTQ